MHPELDPEFKSLSQNCNISKDIETEGENIKKILTIERRRA
jgi:hypothetical protein